MSRKLTPAEQRQAVLDQKAVAVCWVVNKLVYYLLGIFMCSLITEVYCATIR